MRFTCHIPDLAAASMPAYLEDVACDCCRSTDDSVDDIMLCDTCGNGRHLLCSGLHSVPEGKWYCSKFCKPLNVCF